MFLKGAVKADYDAETNISDVEKIKNRRKQNFEDESINMQLDKEDTQRSNLNGKYLSVILVLKYPDSLVCSVTVSNTHFRKVRVLNTNTQNRIRIFQKRIRIF